MTTHSDRHPSGLLQSSAVQMMLVSLAIIVALALSWRYVF